MGTLRIELLGSPRLSHEDRTLPSFPTQRATSLFSFLVVNRGRLYPRDVLAGTFWGERPDSVARTRLRTDIWRIRSTLQTAGDSAERCLLVRQQQVGFDSRADYWLDLQEFESHVREAERLADGSDREALADHLDRALQLYRGDLLEGVYDEWCQYEQERVRARFLQAVEWTMRLQAERGNGERAIALARRLLSHDPLRESIHRELMRLHYRAGDRPAALQQFHDCAELLMRELETEPMEETVALYRSILVEDEPRPPEPTGVPAALPELRRVVEEFDRAQMHLREAMRLLERSALNRELESDRPREPDG